MNLIDREDLSMINQICNSHGNFNDELIENSFLFDRVKKEAWFNHWKHVVFQYNNCLIPQNEKKLIVIEKKLKSHFGNLDLYSMRDFKTFIDLLYSQIETERFFFLKRKKIQVILEKFELGIYGEINTFSPYEKMCLSRLIFDEAEHENLYTEYEGIKKKDLEYQPIKILVLDNENKICSYLLKKKCTIWDEKIGGTIFACPFEKENEVAIPFLRTIFRFYHYYFELHFTSMFYENLDDNNFGKRFSSYIKGKFNNVDFFEPHALLESLSWQHSIQYIMDKYDYIFDDIWENTLVKKRGEKIYVYPNCIVDYISNMTHFRNQKEWRVTSMIIKEKIFESIVGKENVNSILIRSMDSGSLKSGYEYNMYNK